MDTSFYKLTYLGLIDKNENDIWIKTKQDYRSLQLCEDGDTRRFCDPYPYPYPISSQFFLSIFISNNLTKIKSYSYPSYYIRYESDK
jgi:hypothetical protein